MAAELSVAIDRWRSQFDQLMARIESRFARVESRLRAKKLVAGLLAELPRTNAWTVAEYVGDVTPDGMQHLLSHAVWDEDGVRDDLRDYVVEHFGDDDVVLVLDETGDLKMGSQTVGVSRQYTGTAGRVEKPRSRCI